MSYTIEDNHLTEEKQIFDNQGLSYTLDILNTYDQEYSPYSLIIHLIRDNRDCRVGRANCIINSPEDALLGDIQIFDEVPFLSPQDKLYHLSHWNEPTNYQQRGLGTILLKEIINFVKLRQIKKLHGSLTQQDLSKNPKLIQWYQKHGFQIEKPTSDEATTAIHRVCLYLEY
jgi:hypothetical protein